MTNLFLQSFEGFFFWWALLLGKAISLYHQLGVIRITVSAMFKSSRREDMIPRWVRNVDEFDPMSSSHAMFSNTGIVYVIEFYKKKALSEPEIRVRTRLPA